jgi:hypothetical protein
MNDAKEQRLDGAASGVVMGPAKHKERPRDWITLDLEYLAQDTIRDLGREFGAAGPLVFLAILLAAKRAAKGGLAAKRQGTVSLRYRAVAQSAYVEDVEDVWRIVDASVRLGLLVRLDEPTEEEDRFTVRLAKWERWEVVDSSGSERQRRSKARKQAEPESDTEQIGPCH